MLSGDEITAAGLTDWRKLGQGLHARFLDLRLRGGRALPDRHRRGGAGWRGTTPRCGWGPASST